MDIPQPTRLQVDTNDQTLSVEWEDNHVSVFPLHRLREACPCANCNGEDVDNIDPPSSTENRPEKTWTDLHIEPAGSVGVRITWDDGHKAGIFRWDRLRQLQPPSST